MNFLEGKNVVFLSQKVDGKLIFTDYGKVPGLVFLGMGNTVSFEPKIDAKMLFTGYWEVLVLNFSVIGNTVFFESRSWWNDDIYWLMRSSSFELFDNRKYGLFLSQDVDEKMIYTWCFWAFHDIPGPGKYGFSCSV